jgi:hypothetical protein
MFDDIPLLSLTPAALLGLAVLFILTGRLVPRLTLLKAEKEAETWKEAYLNERDSRVKSDVQTRELLELAKTTNSIVYAMFGVTERARQAGGIADVVIQTIPK